jgi:hypothetical protein
VVVVFPASMCAMMPMFRVFANEDCRAIAVYFFYSLAGPHPRSLPSLTLRIVTRGSVAAQSTFLSRPRPGACYQR